MTPTEEMKLAGARSLRDTMGATNFMLRAEKCWAAMFSEWRPSYASAAEFAAIVPDLISRECGGWLAVSPKWCPLKIGVTAATESDARLAFTETMKRWSKHDTPESTPKGVRP